MVHGQFELKHMAIVGTDFTDAAKQAAKFAWCKALQTAEGVGEAVTFAFVAAGAGAGISPKSQTPSIAARFCNQPVARFPPGTSAPTSGQCPCVAYKVTGYLTRTINAPSLPTTQTVWGRIEGFSPIRVNNATTGYNIICRGIASQPCENPGRLVSVGSGDSGGTIDTFVLTGISRIDGSNDNCGLNVDPPISPLPDIGVTVNLNPVFYAPDVGLSPNLTFVPVFVFFQPQLDANFNVNVPFQLNTDINIGAGATLSLSGTINLNTGDINFDFGRIGDSPRSIGSGNCDNPIEPVRDVPEPGGGGKPKPKDEDTDESTVIVGVSVSVQTVNPTAKASVIFQTGNPNIFAPSLGHVSFYIVSDTGKKLGWTTDIPVKNKEQFIPCPYEYGASGVAGTPQPGVEWILTPVRRKIPRVPVKP